MYQSFGQKKKILILRKNPDTKKYLTQTLSTFLV